jgi:uncharacterized protein YbjT (DUF2867 family)
MTGIAPLHGVSLPAPTGAVHGVALVTGASGAIGSRLVDRLLQNGRGVVLGGRRPERLISRWGQLDAVRVDVLDPATLPPALDGIDVAYYLIHSMERGAERSFRERDAVGARNFARAACEAGVRRVVYLGGLGSDDAALSDHLASRHETGEILADEGPPVVELRAAMVIGDGSASFRMLTDLVRRLPAMVLPRWVSTPSQPIALRDVVEYLVAAALVETTDRHAIFEIGGPDVLTYREMIEIVGRANDRHPLMFAVPFLSPTLSAYWCTITTSVPFATARPLVAGMTVPTVVRSDAARRSFPDIEPMAFADAIHEAVTQS